MHGDCLAFMEQFACLVVNQITLDNFAALFNFMLVDRASDSMMARTQSHSYLLIGIGTLSPVVVPPDDILLLQISSYVVFGSPWIPILQVVSS